MTIENMQIWDEVCSTPPQYTKEVSYGKRKFTAIDPQFQLEMATRMWGPYGDRWGLQSLDFTVIPHEINPIMMLEAMFFYPGPSDTEAHAATMFPIAVDMPLKPNDDCCKKLITSARSKALSYLGFSSDVFMGKFDDNHYVQDQKTKYEGKDALRGRVMAALITAEHTDDLDKMKSRVLEMANKKTIDVATSRELLEMISDRETELIDGGM